MKKKIRFMAMLMAVVVLAAGCGGGKSSGSSEGASAKTTSGSTGEGSVSMTARENSPEGSPADASSQDYVKLKMIGYTNGASTNEDVDAVTQAINEHIKPLINAEIEWEILNVGVYNEQINLLLAGDEQADIIIPPASLSTYAAQGALLPLDDLLAQYGQGIIEVMGMDNLNACSYQGQIYAVPTNRDLAKGYAFYYREDWNEQYDLGLENAGNLDDLEAAFAKLLAQDPSKVAVFKNGTSPLTSVYQDWDPLGEGYGVLQNQGDNLKVVNLYETEQYKDFVTRMYNWQQAGYIYKEAATSTISEKDGLTSGTYLGLFANYKPGIDNNYEQNFGMKMGVAHLVDPYATTSTIASIKMAIPRNTVNAERTMQFLNLMYTDPQVVNLLHYGIEGREYVFSDKEKGIITYPEGVDATNKPMDNTLGWMYGNQLISYVWEGKPADVWAQTDEFNKSAKRSLAAGFVFDSTDVLNEVTYCSNVVEKYAKALESGTLDPETGLAEFNRELEGAGINTIIEKKQEQLDAWAKANKIS